MQQDVDEAVDLVRVARHAFDLRQEVLIAVEDLRLVEFIKRFERQKLADVGLDDLHALIGDRAATCKEDVLLVLVEIGTDLGDGLGVAAEAGAGEELEAELLVRTRQMVLSLGVPDEHLDAKDGLVFEEVMPAQLQLV